MSPFLNASPGIYIYISLLPLRQGRVYTFNCSTYVFIYFTSRYSIQVLQSMKYGRQRIIAFCGQAIDYTCNSKLIILLTTARCLVLLCMHSLQTKVFAGMQESTCPSLCPSAGVNLTVSLSKCRSQPVRLSVQVRESTCPSLCPSAGVNLSVSLSKCGSQPVRLSVQVSLECNSLTYEPILMKLYTCNI